MADPRFIHLRLHSEYSITDGMVRLDVGEHHECPPVRRALEYGMPALALTDLANTFGLVKFYLAARGQGVKPILGCDAFIANDADPDRPYRMLLLCRSREGYRRLCELLTQAYLKPRARGRAEITQAMLDEIGVDGLIALSGAALGDVGEALRQGHAGQARERAAHWAALFPNAFYLEVQRPQPRGHAEQEALVAVTARLASETGLPLAATHPIQFLDRDDFTAHETRVCIAEGYTLNDKRRPRPFTEEQYFKSPGEMCELFADLPEALANTVEIAKRCNLELELDKNFLPIFPTPDGVALDAYLATEAERGLARRLERLFPDAAERERQRPVYEERLRMEIGVIAQTGFSGYFLIVADFIAWAKKNQVPVGPGRGSGAGSLVAYSLGITNLDPLKYALLFERFLNPERVSMPDFDIDFCQDKRGQVIEYVRGKYGHAAVSQIATFGTMSSKAVVRDVGRALDLPYSLCDRISKLIQFDGARPMPLARAIEAEPALKAMLSDEQDGEGVTALFELAGRLEDLTRNVGMHAGGVLIAPGQLTDFCPLYSADAGATVVSQYDKDGVEKVGLVKFDFLGLRTLTILDWAVRYVKEVEGAEVDLDALPLDDRETYERIFKCANTTAVFQFESPGMKDTLLKAAPDCIEDLIALNALYRPGPMDNIPNFIARKHGRERAVLPHPGLEKVLGNTHGIMIYQEQVMQTAQVIANYTLGGADILRRAMGKKKKEEMAEQREIFVRGAAGNGIGAGKANEIFDTMETFAGYGFNKSHAAAYSLVAYQTAWLKAHHCAAFMAATLSSEMDKTDTVKFFHDDCVFNKLTVLGPDINASGYRFAPVDRHTIRYGLGAVKGTGEQAVNAIVRAREAGGPFKDLFDFCRRVDKRLVNRRAIEALVAAGAFDAVDDHRARLLASVGIAIESAEQAERDAMQVSLFGAAEEQPPQYLETPRWSERQKLAEEKRALGYFFSGHPFNEIRKEVSRFARASLSALEPRKEPQMFAGLVTGVRERMTSRGKMAFVTLDDGTASLDVSVFNETFAAERGKIREDEPLIVEGKVQRDDYSGEGRVRVVAERLLTLPEARGRFARCLRLSLNGQASSAAAAQRLQTLLAPYTPGHCPVRLAYRNTRAACEIALGDDYRVRLEDDLLAALGDWLHRENVRVEYG
ncbi:MAG: DNA polymerase III subunit alpha [Candidatus Accumulibacter sp.]|jgi:DNA polymerase-3 subunit alpha|nr:DNA polymerase III subunit alpha [Accumulibacter sp.]